MGTVLKVFTGPDPLGLSLLPVTGLVSSPTTAALRSTRADSGGGLLAGQEAVLFAFSCTAADSEAATETVFLGRC